MLAACKWASEQNAVTAWLCRRPGVLQVEVNPVAQTATVVFDPARTDVRAGIFAPAFGLVLRPEIAGLSMSGSTVIVVANVLTLKRLHLPVPRRPRPGHTTPAAPRPRK